MCNKDGDMKYCRLKRDTILSALTRAVLHTWLQDFIKVPPMATLDVRKLGALRVYKSVVVTPSLLCVYFIPFVTYLVVGVVNIMCV